MIGYNCLGTCGFQPECGFGEDGQLVCPDCGGEVTSIAGTTSEEHTTINVYYGDGGNAEGKITIEDYAGIEEAFERAQSEIPADKHVVGLATR